MNIGNAIFDLLNSNVPVTDIVSVDGIFPLVIPQGQDLPKITYAYIDNDPTNDKDGVSKLDVITLDLDIWVSDESGGGYLVAVDLAGKAKAVLDRFSGTNSGVVIQSIKFDSQQELYEKESRVWHISQQYSIRETI